MIVLLLIMVGIGLDTGHIAYIRSQGQPAVDSAALSAATAIPSGNINQVYDRAANYISANDYLNSGNNAIPNSSGTSPDKSITLVSYNPGSTPAVTTSGVTIATANGVRVALEQTNPYTTTVANRQMKSPLFLAPLFNLFGSSIANTANVNVSAVAVIKAQPDLPIAVEDTMCGTKSGGSYVTQPGAKLLQSNTKSDTSGYTTFYIGAASKTQVNNLLDGALNCTGAPSVDVGFCTQLNNGQIASLYDQFEGVFKADTSRCYFIPVIKAGSSFTGCSNITDFAKFCPLDCAVCGSGPSFGIDKASSGSDRWIYGDLTCGQTPIRSNFAKCQVPFLVREIGKGY